MEISSDKKFISIKDFSMAILQDEYMEIASIVNGVTVFSTVIGSNTYYATPDSTYASTDFNSVINDILEVEQ